MGIALISPATGARLTLLTDAQRAFIDRAGRMKSVQADAIDFLHLNRSRETDDSLGAGIQLTWQGTAGRCRVMIYTTNETCVPCMRRSAAGTAALEATVPRCRWLWTEGRM